MHLMHQIYKKYLNTWERFCSLGYKFALQTFKMFEIKIDSINSKNAFVNV